MLASPLRTSALSRLSLFAFVLAPASFAQDDVPEGVAPDDWASVRAIYEEGRHAAVATENGFEARNPGQGWQLSFDRRGFIAKPNASAWSWGFELVSYGFGNSQHEVGELACASADGGRVAYKWDDTIEEWYVNDKRGFEHGFTVHERPARSQENAASDSGPLSLALRVRGDLSAQVQASRRGVAFLDAHGATVLTYSGLTVFDADGKTLPTWFELAPDGLRLSVDEQLARYPLTIDPIAQQAYLKASNTEFFDSFGQSVTISNDTLVVAAPHEASNAVGINGNQANNGITGAGAVYVFVRNNEVWSQQAYLKASNTGVWDTFGDSVALSGDTLVVGALGEASNATGINGNQANNASVDSGAAYVFVRNGAVWSQQAYLKPSNTPVTLLFGSSVSISNDTIVVGAPFESSNATGINGNQNNTLSLISGAAYVFVRNGAVWSQQAYVKASNTDARDEFGNSVAISNDTIIVGAPSEDSNASGINGDQADDGSLDSGAAYVFVRSGAVWSQQAYIKASNSNAGDRFAHSVAISSDTLVVGAPFEASNAIGIGGDQTNNASPFSGAAYVFVRNGSVWSQQAYLKASNTDASDGFANSVAISSDTLVVGAPSEASNATGIDGDQTNGSGGASGAAYVFLRSGSVWNQQGYLKASNTGLGDHFGRSVALSNGTLVVGASAEDSNAIGINGDQANNASQNSGAAYVFDLDAPNPYTDFCSGDSGNQMGCTNCPCGNNAPQGTLGGCINSAGTATRINATGDASVSLPGGTGTTTDLRFDLEGAPGGAFCVLLSGDAIGPQNMGNICFGLNSGVQSADRDGLRCAVMNIKRHGGRSANMSGEINDPSGPARVWGGEAQPHGGIFAQGGFVAGQTRYFQVTHRDNSLAVCMRGLNTSQAIEVTFTP